jgi:hypothetical protein
MSRPLFVGWYGPSDGPWGWIQSHFEHVSLLDGRSLDDWLVAPRRREPHPSKILLIALDHRSDFGSFSQIEQRIASTATTVPNIPVAIVLGNDWHGHRRTFPLPDKIPNFYWYQWYDRIFPWVSELIHQDANSDRVIGKRKTSSERPGDSTPWRVQWILDRSSWQTSMLKKDQPIGGLAWIITDHGDPRDLWRDACEGVGMRAVATRMCSDPPWLEPQLIVVDCVSRSEGCDHTIEGVIQAARARHPTALLAQVASFPTWPQWSHWQSLGVDVILPRPAALQGFLYYWQQWIARTAA